MNADGRAGTRRRRKPSWLRVRPPAAAAAFRATDALLDELRLHTVCDEARCPNRGECFSAGTATFLILGDACTRDCAFCAVEPAGSAARAPWPRQTGGRQRVGAAPSGSVRQGAAPPDPGEPARVAEAAVRLGLAHVVVTSVTRDDLPDGGAAHFAAVVGAVRAAAPEATVEVLVPDFGGRRAALDAVLAAAPDVLAHNLETVPRLYARVRPRALYARPLVKTGLMVGLGETAAEVEAALRDCAAAGVDVVTVGQYLQPRRDCLPVARYVAPDEFRALEGRGAALGLRVVAGPFVRSSYHAAEVLAADGGRE